MNSLNTLFFPGTDIYSIRQYPIFLLFQNINIIKPIEDTSSDKANEPADSFIKSSFCQVHTPCPLGENRKRFLHLVNDIQNRKDDYAAQLSSLTLAAMSKSSQTGDSEREIINSILAPQELQKGDGNEEKELALWQARLVLKIGEILDQEEEEIAGNLAALQDEQEGLFKALKGEDDTLDDENPFADLTQLTQQLGASHHGNAKKRYQAWRTLFLECNLNNIDLLLTTSPDSCDLLQENYEKESGLAPQRLGNLALPAFIGENFTEASQTALTFHEEQDELTSEITSLLSGLSRKKYSTTDGTEAGILFSELTSKWQTMLDKEFPEETHGRIEATLYMFPGIQCSTLLGKTDPDFQEITNGLLIVIS